MEPVALIWSCIPAEPLSQLVYRQALRDGDWLMGASGDPSLYPDQRKWFTCGTIRINDGRYQGKAISGHIPVW